MRYERGATEAPHNRTCPRYYWSDPVISQIRADLADYKRGSLGRVQDLEIPHLDLLRIAESEESAWDAEQTAQLMDD